MELCTFTILGYNGCKFIAGFLIGIWATPIVLFIAFWLIIGLIYLGMWAWYKFT